MDGIGAAVENLVIGPRAEAKRRSNAAWRKVPEATVRHAAVW
jgi:hypothetical protein